MKQTTSLTLFACALIATAPAIGHASERDQQNLVAGEALYDEATRLMNQDKLEQASQKFGEAFAKSQNPTSLYAQAVVERKLGHYPAALKLFETYVTLPANLKVTPEWKAKAEAEIQECQKHVCRLDVRAESFAVDGSAGTGVVSVAPGTHALRMSGKEGERTETVSCTAGQLLTVVYDKPGSNAEPTKSGSWVVPAVLAGVGAVGLGFGIGFGAASGSSKSDLNALQAQRRCGVDAAACEEVQSSTNTQGAVSVVGYALGGAALVGAVISALVIAPWEKKGPPTTGTLIPLVGPDGVGMGYAKRF